MKAAQNIQTNISNTKAPGHFLALSSVHTGRGAFFKDDTMKTCSKCQISKPLDRYSKHTTSKDGLSYWCKDCFNGYLRRRYHTRVPQRQIYRKANRYKLYANLLLHRAVKRGKLIRPNKCDGCQNTCKPDGHHPDYSRPLEVEWLCKPCHLNLHRN